MKKKFSAERSREIRQWVQLLGSMGTIALSIYLSTKFENNIKRNAADQLFELSKIQEQFETYRKIANTNKRFETTTKDFNQIYNRINQHRIQEEIIEAKHEKETELNKATMNGEKIIKFTRAEWSERYSRYSLLKQTYGVDGYYMPDYGEGRVYIYIVES